MGKRVEKKNYSAWLLYHLEDVCFAGFRGEPKEIWSSGILDKSLQTGHSRSSCPADGPAGQNANTKRHLWRYHQRTVERRFILLQQHICTHKWFQSERLKNDSVFHHRVSLHGNKLQRQQVEWLSSRLEASRTWRSLTNISLSVLLKLKLNEIQFLAIKK